MICQFCKRETKGVTGRNSGAVIDVCPACYYPKTRARCDCGRLKNPKSNRCWVCREIDIAKGRILKYETSLDGLRARIRELEETPLCE